ncbi:MAG: RNA-binding S4 domain-containing protein, partial [Anaerolineae bacterium]|nr:RNA-binding S4 domain-containing protein [Anaerolineae bacterium]MDW8072255.1 S4 domain-containing protein [Anaerolineae bacterium]
MSNKIRLDHLLVERGLVTSGSQAQALILAGAVLVEGEVARKPGMRVRSDV